MYITIELEHTKLLLLMNSNMETALKIVDEAVSQHLGRGLNPPEEAVIKGTWQKIGYKEMEKTTEFSRNYLMRDVAPRLWKLLSHVFDEPVNKHNFRSVIENLNADPKHSEVSKIKTIPDRLESKSNKIEAYLSEPWKEMAEGSFVGRKAELNILKQWILEDRAQLVSILGIRGIGKKALAKELVRLYHDLFDCVVWQTFSQPVTLAELIQQLNNKVAYSLSEDRNRNSQQLGHLFEIMSQKRCLIIFDGMETLLQQGNINREYLAEYENYQQFFQKIATISHQSCILVTSLENSKSNLTLETDKSRVHSLLLSGLIVRDAYSWLGTQVQDKASWQNLIEEYQGHPLALKIVQKTIQDIFNGNVKEFLAQKIFVFGELEEMLAKTMMRLSAVEQEILYCLAIESKPVSMNQIQTKISIAVNKAELLGSFISLERRGLLKTPEIKGQSFFSLGSMIKAYISKKLIERVTNPTFSDGPSENVRVPKDIIDLSTPVKSQQVHLSNWLQGKFEADWQSIERLLLDTKKLTERLRGAYYLEPGKSCKRCKSIKLEQDSVIMLVEVKPDSQANLAIRVQVYPSPEKGTLPDKLKLSLINDRGDSLREVFARKEDNFIQLPLLKGKSPEKFSIQLSLDNFSIQEDFEI